jgi:hypothetical protein
MNSSKINDWLQVVGLFGVIGSLMFVGLQMKQDREIALSVAAQARTDTTIQNLMGISANPYFMSAIDKIATNGIESLLPSERQAMSFASNTLLFNFENIHYQYSNGFVPEDRWGGTREALKVVLLQQYYGTRQQFEANPSIWREAFQVVIHELIAEIDAEAAQQ